MLTLLAQFAQARWRRFADRAALEAHQYRRMERFRNDVLARMPLYRPLAASPLEAFPVADKAFVREHFSGLNRLGLSYDEALSLARRGEEREGVTIGMSSGTSGNRGLFLVDAAERVRWAAVMLAKALPRGGLLRHHRVALMLAVNSRLYTTTRASGRIAFRFFDLKQGLEGHYPALEAFRPTLLVAPAHVLGLMARSGLDIEPERVFSAAEVLDTAEAEAIGVRWGRPVHQIYQCTEGFLGITCPHGTLHLNEDYVLFEREWIDQGRRAFNPLVTDFSRRNQAMVRYRMNDVLVAAERPCSCGSPLLAIERIEGRRDDILVPAVGGMLFPDHVRALVLDAAPAALDFQVVQTASGQVELALAGPVPADQVRAAATALSRAGAFTVTIVAYQPPTDHAAKLRRVRSCVP